MLQSTYIGSCKSDDLAHAMRGNQFDKGNGINIGWLINVVGRSLKPDREGVMIWRFWLPVFEYLSYCWKGQKLLDHKTRIRIPNPQKNNCNL